MDDVKLIRKTVYLPDAVIKQLKQSAKQHYRSFNGELIFAAEQYLTHWRRDANNPPQQ